MAIKSVHSNWYEDRRFLHECRRIKVPFSDGDTYETEYVNSFDQKFKYQCRENYILIGK